MENLYRHMARRRDKNRLNDSLTVRMTGADMDKLEDIAIKRRVSLASVARDFVTAGIRQEMNGF